MESCRQRQLSEWWIVVAPDQLAWRPPECPAVRSRRNHRFIDTCSNRPSAALHCERYASIRVPGHTFHWLCTNRIYDQRKCDADV